MVLAMVAVKAVVGVVAEILEAPVALTIAVVMDTLDLVVTLGVVAEDCHQVLALQADLVIVEEFALFGLELQELHANSHQQIQVICNINKY